MPITQPKMTWKQRREASRQAAAWLKATLANDAYTKLYKRYESKLASDDPHEAWLAREILLAYSNRDWSRLVCAKNSELLHLDWLPDRRVRVMWPFGVQLTPREWEIVAYYKKNQIYVVDEDQKVWLFDRRVFDRQYHQVGDSYPDPVYDDLVVGFEARDSDYFEFCDERRRCKNDRPESTDNPTDD